jgi:hypothetical protein
MAAVVAAVVNVTGVQWVSILPITLALSFAGLALGAILLQLDRPQKAVTADELIRPRNLMASPKTATSMSPARDEVATTRTVETDAAHRALWHVGLAVVIFTVSLLFIQTLTGWSMIEVVAVLSVPFAWYWSLLLGRQHLFWVLLAKHAQSIRNLQNTFVVFTAAGYFVQCLQTSPYIHVLDNALVRTSQMLGPTLLVALIPIVTVLLSMTGLHPVVTITLLGASLHPSVLHVSPTWLAIALFGGGVTTFIVSPFNATLNVMAGVTGEAPTTIMRWNAPFSVCFLLLISVISAVGQAYVTLR